MTNFWSTFILIVVIIHFVIGFGYLVYKLSPQGKDHDENNEMV